MRTLRAPNGALVDAADGAVEALIAAGFSPVDEQETEPEPEQETEPEPEQGKKTRKRG